MKKVLLISLILMGAMQLMAQDENTNKELKTLMGPGSSNGGYGGIDMRYGMLDGRDAVTLGARSAWVMNHSFAIGLAGYGFFTDFEREKGNGLYHNLQGGYGGLYFEPIIAPTAAVHFTIPLFFGVGGVAYTSSEHNWNDDPWYNDNNSDQQIFVDDWDSFFIFKPGVEVEVNVFKFFRLSFGGYYNMTTDLEMVPVKSYALEGWEAGVSLKFGKF